MGSAIGGRMNIDRKVGRHHLAFYRGWLQGLDLGDMGDRYLETGIDRRRAKSTLAWIRDVVQQAALRHGKHGMARLLRLRIRVAVSDGQEAGAKKLPTLAQFKEEFDPDEFYTEKELVQAYTEQYPQSVDSKARQRSNVIERQLKALSWVEGLLATNPVPDDLVSAWFDQKISTRLALAGIPNLRGLMDSIRGRGYRWWVFVPKLGEKGANRIIRWLQSYEDSLGVIQQHLSVPIRHTPVATLIASRQIQTAVAPMESFLTPSDLDGSQRANRPQRPAIIDASNDMQAIRSWLNMKSGSPHTQAAYRKETERLLLWAVMERGRALSDISADDCAGYRDWLSILGRTDIAQWPFRLPQEHWIGGYGSAIGRHKQSWRPFTVALSAKSVKYALGILSGFFSWLVQVQYLAFNPWLAVPTKLSADKKNAPDIEMTRAFTMGQWAHLLKHIDSLPLNSKTHQTFFALQLAYSTGMRRAELADATTGRLYSMPLQDNLGVRWMLKVLGKGGKWRAIPMPVQIMDRLSGYLLSRGLNPDPEANPPDTPLIARQVGGTSLTESMIYKVFRALFADVAQKLENEDKSKEAAVFRKASTHWLRHTRGSHLGASGMPVMMIQKLLGHSSVATTSIYTRTDDEQLWTELSKL